MANFIAGKTSPFLPFSGLDGSLDENCLTLNIDTKGATGIVKQEMFSITPEILSMLKNGKIKHVHFMDKHTKTLYSTPVYNFEERGYETTGKDKKKRIVVPMDLLEKAHKEKKPKGLS